jgi:hypothetical protein
MLRHLRILKTLGFFNNLVNIFAGGTDMKKIALISLLALTFLPSVAVSATPVIANVSGTVQTGQTLTITGTTMVDENRSNWDPFFTASASGFEGSSPTADGYTRSCANVVYDSAVRLLGSKSIKTHTSGASNYPSYGTCPYQFQPSANVGDLYFRVYSRWNANSWPDSDNKYWWLGGGETQFLNLEPNGTAAPTRIAFYAPSVNGGNWIYGNIPDGAIQNSRWYLIEMHVKRSGYSPYVVEVWVDNKRVIYTTSVTNGPSYNSWGWEANTNYWSTSASFSCDHWQDGFVISSSRVGPASLIEIGNSSNYSTAIKVYQEPIYLSDSSIQIKQNLSGLGSGPYYLWVTNNRQERSQAFALTGSSGAIGNDTIESPKGLRIE